MNAFIVPLSPVLPEDENIAHGLADRMRALSTISRVQSLMRQQLVCWGVQHDNFIAVWDDWGVVAVIVSITMTA